MSETPRERVERRKLSNRIQQDPLWMRMPLTMGLIITSAMLVYWCLVWFKPWPGLEGLLELWLYAASVTFVGPLLVLWGLRRRHQARAFEALASAPDELRDLASYQVTPKEGVVLDFAQDEQGLAKEEKAYQRR